MSNTATVQWAAYATANFGPVSILAFDKDTNTIFVDNGGTVQLVNYDSNDRFDVDGSASNYAGFEKNLTRTADSATAMLTWTRDTTRTGSRAVHTFVLVT